MVLMGGNCGKGDTGATGATGATGMPGAPGLWITYGQLISGDDASAGLEVRNTNASASAAGIAGSTSSGIGVAGAATGTGQGVFGGSDSGYGVVGTTINGANFAGVRGYSAIGHGVNGVTTNAIKYGGIFSGDIWVDTDIYKSGVVSFVERHPEDSTKAIVYVCLEAGEVGTYCRGNGKLLAGRSEIILPDHFTLVTSTEGLTVQVTAHGPSKGLYVEYHDNERIVVMENMGGTGDVGFSYMVNGTRKGHENYQPVTDSRKIMDGLDRKNK